jgi:signal transduction histidine kinase
MRRASITQSTSFRLAAFYVLLFLLVYLGANLIAYNLVASYLYERLDSHVMERFREIEAAFDARGLDGAKAMIVNHGPAIRGQETLYSLRGLDGTFLAGNVDLSGVPTGLSTLDVRDLEIAPTNYRLFTRDLGPNELVVGVSYDDTNRLRDIALVSFGWATAIVLAAGLGGGALLAFRARRRISTLSDVMRIVGSGELSKRLPISPRMDDIDALAAEVNVALGHLQASVSAMKQVTTDIAHDLKTPISRLFLMLEAANEADTIESSRTLVQTAMEEVKRITSTFEALLRISQIETGARRDRFRVVDVTLLVSEIYEVYADVAIEQGRKLKLLRSERAVSAHLFGDGELLKQMLANLVQNAIRHTPPGSHIGLGYICRSQGVSLFVVDNGPGIPPSETDKVFKRFYRLDKSRTTEGTGLGLSMVKAIADLHGATIGLRDNGPGLVVQIDFSNSIIDEKNPPAEVSHAGGEKGAA